MPRVIFKKPMSCRYCGKKGFTESWQIAQHVRTECTKRPPKNSTTYAKRRLVKPVDGRKKRKWKKKLVEQSTMTLRFCPHCGSNLGVIAAALKAAEGIANGG